MTINEKKRRLATIKNRHKARQAAKLMARKLTRSVYTMEEFEEEQWTDRALGILHVAEVRG